MKEDNTGQLKSFIFPKPVGYLNTAIIILGLV